MMTQEEVRALLVKTGAIMDGHFLLTSGLHSPHYVEKFNVLQHPEYTAQLCAAMAEKFKDANIETVVGPVTGGILLAHETGKSLGTRGRENDVSMWLLSARGRARAHCRGHCDDGRLDQGGYRGGEGSGCCSRCRFHAR